MGVHNSLVVFSHTVARRFKQISQRSPATRHDVVRRFPTGDQVGNPENGGLPAGRRTKLGTAGRRSGLDLVATVVVAARANRSRE